MSFFDAFVGGAAEQATGILNNQMRDDAALEKEKARAQFNADLDEKKQQTKLKLAAEMGQKISDGADQMNFGRIADGINQKNGSSMTADDAKEIAKNPEALKAYGIIDRSRAQTLDDKASVAEKLGALDQAKDIRGQQQVEISRERDEKRDAHMIKQDTLAEKRWQTQDEWQKSRAVIADRIASAQEARMGRMESNQSTQMEKAELRATQQSLQSVLKDAATEDDKIQAQMLSANTTPEQLKLLEGRQKIVAQQRALASNELLKLAGVEPAKAAEPAKNGWDNVSGNVYKNGEVIGTAKSEQDGRSLYNNGPKPPKPEKKPDPGELQLMSAASKAGYTSKVGSDGNVYYSRMVNGQGENLTSKQIADRLGLIY